MRTSLPSLKVLSENHLASGGLWRRRSSVNKVVQHLFLGGRIPKHLALAQICIIVPILSLLQLNVFAVLKVPSQSSVV